MCVALLALWTVYCLYGVVVLAVKHDRGLGFADLALIWLVASALLGGVAGVACGCRPELNVPIPSHLGVLARDARLIETCSG